MIGHGLVEGSELELGLGVVEQHLLDLEERFVGDLLGDVLVLTVPAGMVLPYEISALAQLVGLARVERREACSQSAAHRAGRGERGVRYVGLEVASPVARGQSLVARDEVVAGLYLRDTVYRFAVVRETCFVAARRELAQVLHVLEVVRLVVGEVVDARAGGVYVIGRHDRLPQTRIAVAERLVDVAVGIVVGLALGIRVVGAVVVVVLHPGVVDRQAVLGQVEVHGRLGHLERCRADVLEVAQTVHLVILGILHVENHARDTLQVFGRPQLAPSLAGIGVAARRVTRVEGRIAGHQLLGEADALLEQFLPGDVFALLGHVVVLAPRSLEQGEAGEECLHDIAVQRVGLGQVVLDVVYAPDQLVVDLVGHVEPRVTCLVELRRRVVEQMVHVDDVSVIDHQRIVVEGAEEAGNGLQAEPFAVRADGILNVLEHQVGGTDELIGRAVGAVRGRNRDVLCGIGVVHRAGAVSVVGQDARPDVAGRGAEGSAHGIRTRVDRKAVEAVVERQQIGHAGVVRGEGTCFRGRAFGVALQKLVVAGGAAQCKRPDGKDICYFFHTSDLCFFVTT